MEHAVSVTGLVAGYGSPGRSANAVDGFDLSLEPGEFGVLLGPSGCGKTTVLNCIAGLARPHSGRIVLGPNTVFDSAEGTNLKPNHRGLGMVFQSYSLWPHMTVIKNVEYALRRKGLSRAEAREIGMQALRLVRCEAFADRFPGQLSGGQQQRVALARALAPRPSVVLFDEPLSNLDAKLRRELRIELARLHAEVGFTALYVTHDQSEAFGLGTTICVMNNGRLEQVGSPRAISRRPTSAYVADFLGMNLWDASGWFENAKLKAQSALGTFDVARATGTPSGKQTGKLACYPEDVEVVADLAGAATVEQVAWTGRTVEYVIAARSEPNVRISAVQNSSAVDEGIEVGVPVSLRVSAAALTWLS